MAYDKTRIGYIYGIACPFTGEIKYIGKTDDPQHRFYTHIYYREKLKHMAIYAWINSVMEQGKKPVFIGLCACLWKDLRKKEIEY